jgi:hypothetical protein
MKTKYVLIDYENVHVKSLALLQGGKFQVKVFLGPKNSRLPVELVMAMKELGDKADYIMLETSSSNALDFHITYYLGALVAADPEGHFHIISKDTGFDSLIKHLQLKKISCKRSTSIEQMPCFTAPPPAAPETSKLQQVMGKRKKAASRSGFELLVTNALTDLIKRKKARPSTTKKLLSTIHAKCGKTIPDSEIEAVLQELIKRGYVQVEGNKVTYQLPEELPAG